MNKKLTKKQIKISDWLLERPGYLKKSAANIWFNNKIGILSDVTIALKQAKLDHKKSLNDKLNKTSKEFKGKVSIKSLSDIFPWIKDKGTDRTKAYNIKKFGTEYNPKNVSFKSNKKNGFNKDNVLVIPDTHFPFEKEGILDHCLAMQKKYDCGTVIHIGDEVDLCGVSQWEKDPDGFSPGTEASLAQDKMKLWYSSFPEVKVCIGNHTARPFRQAKANGIPKKFIKSYEEAWEAPNGWQWAENWEINGVLYTHGTGFSGANAAVTIATRHRQNTVIGHIHSCAGIQYSVSKIDIVWGMQLGGALDDKAYAAFYAKDQLKKSVIGCGIVLNCGKLPIYEPMLL